MNMFRNASLLESVLNSDWRQVLFQFLERLLPEVREAWARALLPQSQREAWARALLPNQKRKAWARAPLPQQTPEHPRYRKRKKRKKTNFCFVRQSLTLPALLS